MKTRDSAYDVRYTWAEQNPGRYLDHNSKNILWVRQIRASSRNKTHRIENILQNPNTSTDRYSILHRSTRSCTNNKFVLPRDLPYITIYGFR